MRFRVVVAGCLACALYACGGSRTTAVEAGNAAAIVRGSLFLGCYALSPGPWDDGYILYEDIQRPHWLRLDSVAQGIPLHVAFRAETAPAVGGGLDHVGWWPISRDTTGDTLRIYATGGGWSGYMMTLVVDGDSIRGWAEETSDLAARYRRHAVHGKRRPCPRQ